MFNRTTINPIQRITENSFITITEKKAPTDESVRLLKEFEEVALQKLLSSFEIGNNLFSGRIFFLARIDRNTSYIIKCIINGNDIEFRGVISDYDKLIKRKDEIIKLFFEKISEELALILIRDMDNTGAINENLFR